MQSKVTFGLATIALAFAVGAAAAAPVDALKAAPDAGAMMAHQGAGASGFTSLKSSQNNNLKGASSTDMFAAGATANAMAQPSSSHAWGNGLEALAAVAPSALMASSGTDQAIAPQGAATKAGGFAAVKEASGLRGAPVAEVQSLRAPAAAAENLYRHESK